MEEKEKWTVAGKRVQGSIQRGKEWKFFCLLGGRRARGVRAWQRATTWWPGINLDRSFDAWAVPASLFLLLIHRPFWSLSLHPPPPPWLSSVHLLIVASSLPAWWLGSSVKGRHVWFTCSRFTHRATCNTHGPIGWCILHPTCVRTCVFIYALFFCISCITIKGVLIHFNRLNNQAWALFKSWAPDATRRSTPNFLE